MKFSLPTHKLAYLVATACCLAASVGVIYWALQGTEATPNQHRQSNQQVLGNRSSTESAEHIPSREDFAKLWDRPLRRPLYDPPPPKPVVQQLPPLQVDLLGTILEDTNSMALVRAERGGIEYKRVGDDVGPVGSPGKLIEIGPDSIVVERGQERTTLRVNDKTVR